MGREGKGTEGKGRERKGREGKGREGKAYTCSACMEGLPRPSMIPSMELITKITVKSFVKALDAEKAGSNVWVIRMLGIRPENEEGRRRRKSEDKANAATDRPLSGKAQ